MRPPPGNSGGAVSGAEPCPVAIEAQDNTRNARQTLSTGPNIAFLNLTNPSPAETTPKHTNARSGKTTGRETRFEEVLKQTARREAAHANASLRYARRPPIPAIRGRLVSLRAQRARMTRLAQRRAAQKESARLAFSCSNPDHGEHVTSNASNCSIASPVVCLPRQSSQTHTRQAQDQPRRQELA
jgi:hypothetical protein